MSTIVVICIGVLFMYFVLIVGEILEQSNDPYPPYKKKIHWMPPAIMCGVVLGALLILDYFCKLDNEKKEKELPIIYQRTTIES